MNQSTTFQYTYVWLYEREFYCHTELRSGDGSLLSHLLPTKSEYQDDVLLWYNL